MNILFLEPYYGGSHKAFVDSWKRNSEHAITLFDLPPYKWRWRMRHSAVTFANEINKILKTGIKFDAIICSGMLDLATFIGLAPSQVKTIPTVLYMHENQLTYPVPEGGKRDSDAVFKQITSCLAASEIWWNSKYNLDSFLTALPKYLKRMPDFKMLDSVEEIRKKSRVMYLGISQVELKRPISEQNSTKQSNSAPVTITWAARWEHDKNPEEFFNALSLVKENGIKFKLNVIGEQFRTYPPIFDTAKSQFKSEILNWGYIKSRDDYIQTLKSTDIIVSTAIHEFFGISVLEGVSAGAFPILPKRLAYPELFRNNDFFYNQTYEELAKKLINIIRRKETTGSLWQKGTNSAMKIAKRFEWSSIVSEFDARIQYVKPN